MGLDSPDAVADAIDCGYHHVDTAQIYENESVVGDGIAASDEPRETLTIATKLWIDSLGGDSVRDGTEASLDRLGLDSVDLLYVHRPRGEYDPSETLPALQSVADDGLTRHVGLSNFEREQLTTARDFLDEIAAHQVEFHPYFHREEILADAQAHDYPLVAYSPLAGGEVLDDPVICDIAETHDSTASGDDITAAAVSIAWVLSHENVVTIPRASTPAHRRANLAAEDIELSSAEVARIDDIDREQELFPE